MPKTGDAGALVEIDLGEDADSPLHRRLADALRRAVETGRLAAGARLPSTRTLARDWGVSRNTVLQVFETLAAEGYLDARVGDGTYVARLGEAPAPAKPSAPPPPEPAPPERPRASFPFRSLSQRGRLLIAQSLGDLAEKPAPFMPDVPDLRAFPLRSWLRMMNEVSGRLTGEILVNVSNAGYRPLREAIAHHLLLTREVSCTPDQVIVTTGSQQSLDLVTRLLVERGDPVWVEEPGYVGARASLVANGCAVMPAPCDEDGIDVERALGAFPAPRLVVVSPARSYPLGGRLSARRRAALLDLSYRAGAWILEDDYDSDFRYDGVVPRPLRGSDPQGRVVMMGTFSKTLLPSFRLGFIVAPADLADEFARARAVIDRHAPILEQMVLAEFMHRGLYGAHLRRMRALYRQRQASMLGVLDAALGYAPPASETAGGTHFVVPLAPDVDDVAAARELWAEGVVARPLSIYFAGRRRRPGLLLGYGAYTEAEQQKAGRALGLLRGRVAHATPALPAAAE